VHFVSLYCVVVSKLTEIYQHILTHTIMPNMISASICTPLEHSVHKLIKGTPKSICGTLADQTCLPLFVFAVCVRYRSHYTIPPSVMNCLSKSRHLAKFKKIEFPLKA